VYDILQVRIYLSWNIDYQTFCYLSLIFHVTAQLSCIFNDKLWLL